MEQGQGTPASDSDVAVAARDSGVDQDTDLGGAAAAGEEGRVDLEPEPVVDLDPVTLADETFDVDLIVQALSDPDVEITFHAEDSGFDDY